MKDSKDLIDDFNQFSPSNIQETSTSCESRQGAGECCFFSGTVNLLHTAYLKAINYDIILVSFSAKHSSGLPSGLLPCIGYMS